MVVAQLVKRSLPTPEICSSNPFVSKFTLLSAVLKREREREREKEKEDKGVSARLRQERERERRNDKK